MSSSELFNVNHNEEQLPGSNSNCSISAPTASMDLEQAPPSSGETQTQTIRDSNLNGTLIATADVLPISDVAGTGQVQTVSTTHETDKAATNALPIFDGIMTDQVQTISIAHGIDTDATNALSTSDETGTEQVQAHSTAQEANTCAINAHSDSRGTATDPTQDVVHETDKIATNSLSIVDEAVAAQAQPISTAKGTDTEATNSPSILDGTVTDQVQIISIAHGSDTEATNTLSISDQTGTGQVQSTSIAQETDTRATNSLSILDGTVIDQVQTIATAQDTAQEATNALSTKDETGTEQVQAHSTAQEANTCAINAHSDSIGTAIDPTQDVANLVGILGDATTTTAHSNSDEARTEPTPALSSSEATLTAATQGQSSSGGTRTVRKRANANSGGIRTVRKRQANKSNSGSGRTTRKRRGADSNLDGALIVATNAHSSSGGVGTDPDQANANSGDAVATAATATTEAQSSSGRKRGRKANPVSGASRTVRKRAEPKTGGTRRNRKQTATNPDQTPTDTTNALPSSDRNETDPVEANTNSEGIQAALPLDTQVSSNGGQTVRRRRRANANAGGARKNRRQAHSDSNGTATDPIQAASDPNGVPEDGTTAHLNPTDATPVQSNSEPAAQAQSSADGTKKVRRRANATAGGTQKTKRQAIPNTGEPRRKRGRPRKQMQTDAANAHLDSNGTGAGTAETEGTLIATTQAQTDSGEARTTRKRANTSSGGIRTVRRRNNPKAQRKTTTRRRRGAVSNSEGPLVAAIDSNSNSNSNGPLITASNALSSSDETGTNQMQNAPTEPGTTFSDSNGTVTDQVPTSSTFVAADTEATDMLSNSDAIATAATIASSDQNGIVTDQFPTHSTSHGTDATAINALWTSNGTVSGQLSTHSALFGADTGGINALWASDGAATAATIARPDLNRAVTDTINAEPNSFIDWTDPMQAEAQIYPAEVQADQVDSLMTPVVPQAAEVQMSGADRLKLQPRRCVKSYSTEKIPKRKRTTQMKCTSRQKKKNTTKRTGISVRQVISDDDFSDEDTPKMPEASEKLDESEPIDDENVPTTNDNQAEPSSSTAPPTVFNAQSTQRRGIKRRRSTKHEPAKKPKMALPLFNFLNSSMLWYLTRCVVHGQKIAEQRMQVVSDQGLLAIEDFLSKSFTDERSFEVVLPIGRALPDAGNYRFLRPYFSEKLIETCRMVSTSAVQYPKKVRITSNTRSVKTLVIPKLYLTGPTNGILRERTGAELVAEGKKFAINKINKVYADGSYERIFPEESSTLVNQERALFKLQVDSGVDEKRLPVAVIHVENAAQVMSPQFKKIVSSSSLVIVRGLVEAVDFDFSKFNVETIIDKISDDNIIVMHQMPQPDHSNKSPATGHDDQWYSSSFKATVPKNVYKEHYQKLEKLSENAFNEIATTGDHVAPIEKLKEELIKEHPESFSYRNRGWKNVKETGQYISFGTNLDVDRNPNFVDQWAQLDKLPEFLHPTGENNMMKFANVEIPGINLVQMYVKPAGSRTAAHMENSGLTSININKGPGDCVWLTVPFEYSGKMEELCKSRRIEIHAGHWPNETKLLEAGIPVQRIIQKPNDLVFVGPGTWHWVQANGLTTNIAWNVGQPSFPQLAVAALLHDDYCLKEQEMNVPLVYMLWEMAKEKAYRNDPFMYPSIKTMLAKSVVFCQVEEDYLKDLEYTVNPALPQAIKCGGCRKTLFNTFVSIDQHDFCINCASLRSTAEWKIQRRYTIGELVEIFDAY